MSPPRFTAEQVEILQRFDPAATYHPPSRPGAADDFLELSDGTALPNELRAAEWLRTQPTPAPVRACARPGRPRLSVIAGGRAS